MLSVKITSSFASFIFCAASNLIASNVLAHEYWVDPTHFVIQKGDALKANLRNGQNFKGFSHSYIKDTTDIYLITNSSQSLTPNQRTGNLPAFDFPTQETGLHIASYQGTFDQLKFETWDKFEHYVENQGFNGLLEEHNKRGLPKTGFKEQYARASKALIQVGNKPSGEDKLTGLNFELVANKNPYTLSQNDTLPVTLYYEGEPVSDKQIEVFRDSGIEGEEVSSFKLRTNDQGVVNIKLTGGGKFMLNSVYIYAGDEDPNTELAAYQSYWANLVFGIKGTAERFNTKNK